MRKFLSVPFVVVLLWSLGAVSQTSAQDGGDLGVTCTDNEVVWGIQRGFGEPYIYQIDLSTKTATFVTDTGKNVDDADYPNGAAYDVPTNRPYYAERVDPQVGDSFSNLWFFDASGGQVFAGDLTGVVAGATIHEGVYYYIPQQTGDLWAAALRPDGTIGSNTLVKADVSGVGSGYGFGDMVITADGSTMYVSAGTGGVSEFFSIDLSGDNYQLIATGDFKMQLAFGLEGNLYGHNAGTGMFYDVDLATGALTEIGTVTGSQTGTFTDLASFQTRDCEPVCTLAPLDFESDPPGTILDDDYAPGIAVTTNAPDDHPAMLFDSAAPDSDDKGTPNEDFGGPGIGSGGEAGAPGENSDAQGNVVIISKDGDSSDPDDYNGGGTITFTFDPARPVHSVQVLDIDTDETGSVVANLVGGGQVVTTLASLGDNSYQDVAVNAALVSSLDVTFSSSAALVGVSFCPPPCADTEVVWGIQRGVDVPYIYQIDLSTNTATFVTDTGQNVNETDYPNGAAYDARNDRPYYAVRGAQSSTLWFFDESGGQVRAGDLSGTVAGATIHERVYYYIPQGTGDLWAAALRPDGTIGSNTRLKADVSGVGSGYGFGDMVITADGKTMYVSAGTGGVSEFFSIEAGGNNYQLIATGDFKMQLAFGLEGNLYGHNAGTGMFYDVDLATGALTEIGTVTGSQTGTFTDLASFQVCVTPT